MDTKTTFAKGQLRSLVERIERLEEEKRALAGDIREVYGEAKANGFDTKILRKVLTIRRKDRDERAGRTGDARSLPRRPGHGGG